MLISGPRDGDKASAAGWGPPSARGPAPSDSPAAFTLGYRPWLDGLRGVAILAVLACHFGLLNGGILGVDLFFVLSGFLITALLAQEWRERGTISLGRFYLRRALRLVPGLALMLLGCGVATLWMESAQAATLRQHMAMAACYVTNWWTFCGWNVGILGHTWSLSLEEQFYLLWPVLLLLLLRWGLSRRTILLVVAGGVVLAAVERGLLSRRYRWTEPEWLPNLVRLYTGLDTRADALLVGCLVGLLAVWGMLPQRRGVVRLWSVLAAGSAVALAWLFWTEEMTHAALYRGRFTLVALLVAAILVRLLCAPCRVASLVLESRPLVGIGQISYSLYLFHQPLLLGWLRPNAEAATFAKSALAAVLTFAAALASYYLVERPCLRLRQRLHGRDRGQAAGGHDRPHRAAAA